jgi:hypothetical protein
MPRLSPFAVSALLLAGALALACKDSKEDTQDPACTLGQPGASCTAGGECCSGNCQNNRCVVEGCTALGTSCALASQCCSGACNSVECVDPNDPVNPCDPVGVACDAPTDCCTGVCTNGLCAEDDEGCLLLTHDCTAGTQCCSGVCENSKCAPPTTAGCGLPGVACTYDSQCCSAACDATGHCSNDGGACDYPGEPCATDSDCCSQNCPNAGTAGATCSSSVCRQVSQTCSDDGQCCSGLCGAGNVCEALPPGGTSYTCKTLGEACTLPGDCCSTNCQGGTCKPAASCNAPGDVCVGPNDCCSGLCAQTALGVPGRCEDDSGGCGLDGYPCTSDSNCCTKKCVDLGTGATVCQPSGGCRMTGNFCDSTASCCGGTNEADPSIFNSYGVFCDGPGTVPGAPEWDPRTQDGRTCTGGQACNPPGNICGYKASQNCCYAGGGSGKVVCKPDENQILRCFGGPVDPPDCVPTPDDPCCLTGWDGNDPLCCIPAGDVCQFKDQCCGNAPCVPDASGVLRCAATSCMPEGSICSVGSAPTVDPCCEGTSCRDIPELGWACTDVIGDCALQGQACGGANPSCCFGSCESGTCGAACAPNGDACTSASQCCSSTCSGGFCVPSCQDATESCTVNDDCCAELTCDIPAGETSGTCSSGDISTCAQTGSSCLTKLCCNSDDTCSSGICTPPAPPPVCSGIAQYCSSNADCCQSPEALSCFSTDAFEQLVPCDGTSVACFCDVPPTACIAIDAPCSTTSSTCCGSSTCTQNGTSSTPCTSNNPADCACKTVG